MSIEKVKFTRGIKGKREEGSQTHVTIEAVGKLTTETRKTKNANSIAEAVKNPTATVGEPDSEGRVVITEQSLIEDGIVTNLDEAMSLMEKPQDACDALVRHYNYLAYRKAVEAVVGVEAPDELDEVIGDSLSDEEKTAFKRNVSNVAKMTGESRLDVAGMLLPKLIAKKAKAA